MVAVAVAPSRPLSVLAQPVLPQHSDRAAVQTDDTVLTGVGLDVTPREALVHLAAVRARPVGGHLHELLSDGDLSAFSKSTAAQRVWLVDRQSVQVLREERAA